MTPTHVHPRPHAAVRFAGFRLLLSALLALFTFTFTLTGAEAPKKAFDVPAGDASATLKKIAQQAGQQVVFPAQDVRGIQTAAVRGEYTLREALDHMLADTGLVVAYDAKSSTFAVSKADPNAKWAITKNSDRPAQAKESAGGDSLQLEVLTVTAQKRVENVQDVPLSITAMSASMLEERGIRDPIDLQKQVPGMVVGEVNRNTGIITMRGVGAINNTIGGDSGVTVYMDGHYLQSPGYALQSFMDLARVEVLRGPQGTFAGRNAIGGTLNLIPNRPTKEFEGSLSADFGNYSKVLLTGVVSGPITDRIRGRLAVQNENRDGYVENLYGVNPRNSHYSTMRGMIEVDQSDNLTALLTGYRYFDTSDRTVRQFTTDPSPQTVNQNGPFDSLSDANGGSADLTWKLGEYEFRSLTAYNNIEWYLIEDYDASVRNFGLLDQRGSTETWTQEFQLLSPQDRDFKWVLGSFYYDEDTDFLFRVDNRGGASPDATRPNLANLYQQAGPTDLTSRSAGVFAQTSWTFARNWKLIAGIRGTQDKKTIVRRLLYNSNNGVAGIGTQQDPVSRKWSATTGELSLNYHPSKDVMVYALASRGYRAGGYVYTSVISPAYNPEYVTNIELGLKSLWLNKALQVNISAFHMDYKDRQERVRLTLEQGVSYIVNAADVTIKGVEIETQVRPTKSLRFNANLSFMDGKYDRFTAFNGLLNGGAGGIADYSGNRTASTPRVKYTLGAAYAWDLGLRGSLEARADTSVTGHFSENHENNPLRELPGFVRTDARLTWRNAARDWSGELYALNVDKGNDYTFGAGTEIFYLAPRTYGVRLKRSF